MGIKSVNRQSLKELNRRQAFQQTVEFVRQAPPDHRKAFFTVMPKAPFCPERFSSLRALRGACSTVSSMPVSSGPKSNFASLQPGAGTPGNDF